MGRRALVTGAAGDLGRATCAALARDGWSLFVTDRPEAAAALDATRAVCEAAGAQAAGATFDVTDEAAVTAGVAALVAEHGVPTAVVAAAGLQGDFAPLPRHDVAAVRRVLEVNVVGVFNTMQVSARHMIDAGVAGSIVAFASMAGVAGAPNMPGYAASKAAVIGLVKGAALDLAPHGIRVNAVSPAFIGPGAMWDNQLAQQARAGSRYYAAEPEVVADQMLDRVALARCGTPDEVADVVAFLAGPRSSYVTGTNLEVAGGEA